MFNKQFKRTNPNLEFLMKQLYESLPNQTETYLKTSTKCFGDSLRY